MNHQIHHRIRHQIPREPIWFHVQTIDEKAKNWTQKGQKNLKKMKNSIKIRWIWFRNWREDWRENPYGNRL